MASKKSCLVLFLALLLLFGGASSFSTPSSPSRIVNGFFSNAFSFLMKRFFWSLKASTKTAISGKPLMRFENGYNVETVFDGSKLGIEPYSVEILPDGDLLILDSANSNLYKISSSLNPHSRPKFIAGSADGYSGHVDGGSKDARMNHPKGLTVDDRGNIYVADAESMAVRKISDTGVTTIAGGKRGLGGTHVDGPSEDAKFSNDFDVVYLGSSCSLLVIDRGNKAIREIQLNFDDCAYQYGAGFPLDSGIAVLLAAGFFGYMLALLQRRVGLILSSSQDKPSLMLPPLIPQENEREKRQKETFLGKLIGGAFPIFRQRLANYSNKQNEDRNRRHHNSWPVQESFNITNGDDSPPPMMEARTPTPKKTYAFMSKDSEKMQQLKQSRVFYSGWDADLQKQQKQAKKHHQHQHQYQMSSPQTFYEQTDAIVFGAVQER